MQVGDTFNIIWKKTKYKCRVVEIDPSSFDRNFTVCTVDLLGPYNSVFRTHFFGDMLMKLKKQAGPTWSCKPRYPKRSCV